MTDADYMDDLPLLANAQTQAKSQLHCLEKAVGGIGFQVNANKTVLIFLNKEPLPF